MRRAALLLICSSVSACHTNSSSRHTAQVTDSAGVTITTSYEASWPNGPWTLASEPRLTIGMVNGPEEYEFASIRNALRLPDSRIVVASFRNPPNVRFYAQDGSHILTVGGNGGGPGEFAVVSWIDYRSGDTLRVFDGGQARLSYFDLEGNFLGSVPLLEAAGRRVATLEPGFSDGDFLVPISPRFPNELRGHFRIPVPLVRLSLADLTIDTLATVKGAEYFIQPSGWGKRVKFGLGPPGILPNGDRFFVTTGESYRVDEYTKDGVPRRSFRRVAQRRPVQAQDVAALEESELQRARGSAGLAEIRRWIDEIPHADSLPAYDGAMILDADANIWVRRYSSLQDSIAQWDVFDPEGKYLGTVDMPLAFDLLQVGSDEAVGRWRDELGVESVHIYELVKQR